VESDKEPLDGRLYTVDRDARPTYKNERAKPESHVESVTSICALPPTIPKIPLDIRPYTVDRDARATFGIQPVKPESHMESVTSIYAATSFHPKETG